MAERARQVNGEYIAKARTLDHEHSRQADGTHARTRYPGVREQVQGHLVGPVLAALRAGDSYQGSYQGCSEALHGLAREAAKAKLGDGEVAADGGGCGACLHAAQGIYTHDVHRRWGSVFWPFKFASPRLFGLPYFATPVGVTDRCKTRRCAAIDSSALRRRRDGTDQRLRSTHLGNRLPTPQRRLTQPQPTER